MVAEKNWRFWKWSGGLYSFVPLRSKQSYFIITCHTVSEVAHSFLSVLRVRDRHKGEQNLHRPTISRNRQYLSVCWSVVSLSGITL